MMMFSTPGFLFKSSQNIHQDRSTSLHIWAQVHLVKVLVFPVVIYGCESWTIKKAEHRRIGAFEL